MTKPIRTVVAALSAVALVALAACSGGGIDSVTSFEKKVTWGDCKGDDAPEKPYECATVTVPLDYRDASGDTLKIALVRLPAMASKAKGVVLTNPGGPGGSGIDLVNNIGTELAGTLGLDEFDIVGFDPRGVDKSGGLRCLTDAQLDDFLYVDDTPDTPEEEKIDAESDKYDEACTDKYGEKIRLYSTEYAARDMDIIRASLGFEKIHYLGISYGTYLGGVYATLFPDRVASMVLDGALDPQGDTPEQEAMTQAVGFEKAFNNWVAWCEKSADSCAFHSSDVKKAWNDLYEALDRTSLVSDGRDVNHEVLDTATKSALYAESQWPELGRALAAARDGDGAPLQRLADDYNGRQDDGKYDSSNESFYVIYCSSGMEGAAPSDPGALLKKLKAEAPWYSRDYEESDLTERWCEDGFGDPDLAEVKYDGEGPIVVIGGKNDPATPFRWAEELTANMGANARLVEFSGEGHSQILVSGCVDEIAGALFTRGTLPKKGKVCAPDTPMARPAWWNSTVQVSGTELDTETMNSYFGLKPAKAYARYYALAGSASTELDKVSSTLRSKGLQWSEGDNTDPTESAQWFYDGTDSDKFVGVYIESVEQLEKNDMSKPVGIVPENHVVMAVFYYP